MALSDAERRTLEGWARRRSSAQALALRARIVLGGAAGQSNTELAERLGVTRMTVAKWRGRFVRGGVEGLLDEPRPGRPRTIGDEKVEEVITKTLESTPRDATHWSTRSMAAEVGLSQTAISRIWRAFGLQPHRVESFKLSTDPLFVDKVRDVVGLYLDPPERALVLCVDEKVRHEALLDSGGVRDPTLGRRSGLVGAEGSLIPELRVRAGSSPDNDVTRRHYRTSWVRQARRSGETRVNQ